MKIALVSFDGIDPRVIYNNRDDLENFDRLLDETMHGKWKTPGHTIPSYTVTLTGETFNLNYFYWDVDEGGFARHRQFNVDYLWDITDSSMTLLNIPTLYPPEEIDDCMVCGMVAPDNIADTNLALPQEAQWMLNDIDYIHEVRADKVFNKLGPENMFDLLCNAMDIRVEAAENLIEMYDSELFYGVWTSTDRWFHRHHTDRVDYYRMYKKADEVLGEILEIIPDDIPLVVFSDHGFGHFPEDIAEKQEYVVNHNTGHMIDGWYSIRHEAIPNFRDDTASIEDLFPTVLNYLGEEIPEFTPGRILFHREDQDDEVKSRLEDLGYL